MAFLLSGCMLNSYAAQRWCSYDTYQWSTIEKRAVNRQHVTLPYSELGSDAIDPQTGCSVCREDQVEITIPGIEPFMACHIVAPAIESALGDLIAAGVPVHQVIGYRVGMTRGDTDDNGLRTHFSNHSFGVAVDINPQHNGLYERCIRFGPECRLIRGGEWRPHSVEASHHPDGAVVNRFKQEGFLWGGEIRGRQKDFMHFSPSGY